MKIAVVADVAQLAEQLICNQQVGSSILPVSSADNALVGEEQKSVGCPSGQREQTVNLPANAYEGSNPSPTLSRGAGFFCRYAVVRSSQLFAAPRE
jgi:hypothetical protein